MRKFFKKLWHEMSFGHTWREVSKRQDSYYTMRVDRCDCGMERETFAL